MQVLKLILQGSIDYLETFNMNLDNIEIIGFKANIDSIDDTLKLINDIKKDDEIIQIFNADAIVSVNHIIHGVNQAFLSFERGVNLANDISVEIVLRCSAQRQISKAFKMLGLKEGSMNLCVVLINCEDYTDQLSSIFTYDESVLVPDNEKLMEIYQINDVEINNMTIEELIIDKISKLTVDY